jgi:hypothetical protein
MKSSIPDDSTTFVLDEMDENLLQQQINWDLPSEYKANT